MPVLQVMLWYPTITGDNVWGELPFGQKLEYLDAAVEHARGFFAGGALQGIFASPEYTLVAPCAKNAQVAWAPIPLRYTSRIFNHLEQLSRRIPRVLFIPGSMMVLTGRNVQNRSIGYFNGESELFCGKRRGVGETAPQYEFLPGEGGSRATVGGVRFGLQICADASPPHHGGPDTRLTAEVDVHIAVSAGLALSNMTNPGGRAPQLRIVAERGGADGTFNSGGVARRIGHTDDFALVALTLGAIPNIPAAFAQVRTCTVEI